MQELGKKIINLGETAKLTIPVNTSGVVGQAEFIEGTDGTALNLPSGGTWLILSSWGIITATGVVTSFSADKPTNLVLAGGSEIRPARAGHTGQAYIMRIA